jgi:hypothetical protein
MAVVPPRLRAAGGAGETGHQRRRRGDAEEARRGGDG